MDRRYAHSDVMRGKPADYESITVSNTAKSLTAAKYNDATMAVMITIEDADIRFRLDGTAPTSSEGHALYTGNSLMLNSIHEIMGFQAIRSGASDAKLRVTYIEYIP